MYGIGVDISRFVRGLWTGVKQPALGSSYDPDMVVALGEMELDEDVSNTGSGSATPLPAE